MTVGLRLRGNMEQQAKCFHVMPRSPHIHPLNCNDYNTLLLLTQPNRVQVCYPEWLHLGQWPLHSFPKLPPLRANMKHQAWCLSLHVMPRSHYHSPTKQYKRLGNIAAVAHRLFYNLKSVSICGSVPQNVLLRFSVRANMKRQAYCQSLYVVLSLPQYHSLSRQKGIYWKWQ